MDEQTYMDFTTALGEEYFDVISPLCEFEPEPHDGYEVFAKVYGLRDITPEKLHAAQSRKDEVTRLRDATREWHETDDITSKHVLEVLQRVLQRWPPASA